MKLITIMTVLLIMFVFLAAGCHPHKPSKAATNRYNNPYDVEIITDKARAVLVFKTRSNNATEYHSLIFRGDRKVSHVYDVENKDEEYLEVSHTDVITVMNHEFEKIFYISDITHHMNKTSLDN